MANPEHPAELKSGGGGGGSSGGGDRTVVELSWIGPSFEVELDGHRFGGSIEFWDQFTRQCGNFVRREGDRVAYRPPLDLTRLRDRDRFLLEDIRRVLADPSWCEELAGTRGFIDMLLELLRLANNRLQERDRVRGG